MKVLQFDCFKSVNLFTKSQTEAAWELCCFLERVCSVPISDIIIQYYTNLQNKFWCYVYLTVQFTLYYIKKNI